MWPLLLLSLCSASTFSQNLDHRFFLAQIIEKYGQNGSITYEGFERLYKNLGLGNTSSNHNHIHGDKSPLVRTSRGISLPQEQDSSEEQLESLVDQHKEVTVVPPTGPATETPKCFAPAQLLAVYGVPRGGRGLTPVGFLHLCPSIIYQLDQRLCSWSQHNHTAHPADHTSEERAAVSSSHSNWFFALLTILVISLSGLLVVAIIPLLHKMFINQLISFLVALAVGTLLGDAFLHLIPHALESHGHGHGGQDSRSSHKDAVFKTGLMFLTVLFFFTFEAVLNIKKGRKRDSGEAEKTTYAPIKVCVHQHEKEMMQVVDVPDAPDAPPAPQVTRECPTHNHSSTALMVILGDGLHNLTDGLAVGAAFSGGLAPGLATAVAVFTHELPHELGDFAVLLQSGLTVRKALVYNIVSSVLSLFGVAIGLIVGNFGDSTRWIYAITAGSFIYIALSNLVPEMNKQKSSVRTIFLRVFGILCGGAIMGTIALYEEDIQAMFS